MRHRKSGRHLSRTSSHRSAMFRNMAASLIKHELIKTTVPKAKELRRVAEPLITMSKSDSVSKRRLAFARLRDKAAVGKLFAEVAICGFSSAATARAIRPPWPMSNWSTVRRT